MASLSLTGRDIFKFGNRTLFDLADGDCVTITFPNEVASVKTGKDGNSIFALNESGRQADVSVRLIRASADDVYLNGLFRAQMLDFPSATLPSAQAIKRIGNSSGVVRNDTYILEGGIFLKQPEAISNVEGNTDQAVTVWAFRFANAKRAIF